ncbi:MAG: hypothetical protein AB7N80_06700 [Bdellovibrionales bacterium]
MNKCTGLCTLFLFTLLTCGCASTGLLSAKDYEPSRAQLKKGQPQMALAEFPQKREVGGFLTTVETGYLNLLGATPKPEPMVKISDELEKREVIYVSKELGHFFYQESEDGYLPAEHEVIWLHLVAGLSYAAQQKREPARVEAQRAAQLLQGHYSERTGDFDDPGLRLILAGLWLYCNEWEHARVDLRRAFELDNRYKWAKAMAEKDDPPTHLQIVLVGSGPEPTWQPNTTKSALTGLESLRFDVAPLRDQVTLYDENGQAHVLMSGSNSKNWYTRHQQRNSQIRDAVSGSRYLTKAAGQSAYTGTGMFLSKVTAGTFMAAGIAVAVAVVVGALKIMSDAGATGSGDAAAYVATFGLGIGAYTVNEASKFDQRNMTSLKKDWDETLNPSMTYRYMRFLPNQIFAGSLKQESLKAQRANGLPEAAFLKLHSPGHKTKVSFYFLD